MMGLFSGLLGKGAKPLDVSAAVMIPMIAAVMADGSVDDDEVRQIRSICAWSPIYAANSTDQDTVIIERAAREVSDQGSEDACKAAAAILSPALQETAFIFAVRIVFSDGHVAPREELLIESLANWLGIESSRARNMIEVVSIMQHDIRA